jgi:hypothetical protein
VASGEWRVASGELRKKESIKVNCFFRQILLSNRRPGLDCPSQAFLFAIRPFMPLLGIIYRFFMSHSRISFAAR